MNAESAAVEYVNNVERLYHRTFWELQGGVDRIAVPNQDQYDTPKDLGREVLDRISTIEVYHDDLEEILDTRGEQVSDQSAAFDILDEVNAGTRDASDHLDLAHNYLDIATEQIKTTQQDRSDWHETASSWKKPLISLLDSATRYSENSSLDRLESYQELVAEAQEEYERTKEDS